VLHGKPTRIDQPRIRIEGDLIALGDASAADHACRVLRLDVQRLAADEADLAELQCAGSSRCAR